MSRGSAAASGNLGTMPLEIDPRYATTIMVVSGGYPGSYPKGKVITGAGNASEGSVYFHAGTKKDAEGNLVTSGGRVIACSAYGEDLDSALAASFRGAAGVDYEGKYFRRDIGADLQAIEKAK